MEDLGAPGLCPCHDFDLVGMAVAGSDSTLGDSGKLLGESNEVSDNAGGDATRKQKYKPKSGGFAGELVMAMVLSSTIQPAESSVGIGNPCLSMETPKVHWP